MKGSSTSYSLILNVFTSFDIQRLFKKSACVLSSTTKKGEIESAIMPLILFWCWWQHAFLELIMLSSISQDYVSSAMCVDHDYKQRGIYYSRAENTRQMALALYFHFVLEYRDPALLRGDRWIAWKTCSKYTKHFFYHLFSFHHVCTVYFVSVNLLD